MAYSYGCMLRHLVILAATPLIFACSGELTPKTAKANADADVNVPDAEGGGGEPTWTTAKASFDGAGCLAAGCHGNGGSAGSYKLDTYADALEGGSDGTANVIAGDATSKTVEYCENEHFNGADIAVDIKKWVVDYNAQEKEEVVAAQPSWTTAKAAFSGAGCLASNCHGDGGSAGSYKLDTYAYAIEGGTDGTANIIGGDATSKTVEYCENAHFGGAGIATEIKAWVVDYNAQENSP